MRMFLTHLKLISFFLVFYPWENTSSYVHIKNMYLQLHFGKVMACAFLCWPLNHLFMDHLKVITESTWQKALSITAWPSLWFTRETHMALPGENLWEWRYNAPGNWKPLSALCFSQEKISTIKWCKILFC